MFSGSHGVPPLTMISAFAGIFCMMIAATSMCLKPIRYIGENSLLYFAWHEQLGIPICGALLKTLGLPWNDAWSSLTKFAYQGLQMLVIVLMLTGASFVINHTKLRVMVGK